MAVLTKLPELHRWNPAMRPIRWLFAFYLVVVLLPHPIGLAQTTPRVESVFPSGAARGTEVEVQVSGEFLTEDTRLVVAGQGIELAKALGSQRYLIRVRPDAPLGPCEFRLVATQGASAPFPFLIGDLSEIIPPDRFDLQPTPLAFRTLVHGRLESSGQIDRYSIPLTAGQTIVCAIQTRAIRSPLEPELRLLGPDGTVVATSFASPGADALLFHQATAAETYTLQVFDFQLQGGPFYLYRLMATDGPWLDQAFPSALTAGQETEVTLTGWNLPGGVKRLTRRMTGTQVGELSVALPEGINQLLLPVGMTPSLLESEPNDDGASALPIPTPIIVHGRIEARGEVGDRDLYAFQAQKGQTLVADLDAAQLSSPLDAVLAVLDEAGKKLIEVDDFESSRDPVIRFTAPADGTYRLAVRSRAESGGEDCIYRLALMAPRPDIALRVNTTSVYIENGKTASLPVLVNRLDGLTEELELLAVDLPTGITVEPQVIPEKTPATITLVLTASEEVAVAGGLVRIVARGRGTASDKAYEAVVADGPAATAPFSRYLWVAAGPTIPFALKTTTTILEAPRMAAFRFPVQVERKDGFIGPIRLVGVERDKRGTVVPLPGQIQAEADQGFIPLVIQHKVTEGTTHRCRVMGVADLLGRDGKTYQLFHVAAGAMAMGCQPSWLNLVARPDQPHYRPGQALEVSVDLASRVPLELITLRLEPPLGAMGVTCEPVVVTKNTPASQLTLHIAADAQLPPRASFTIRAESVYQGQPVFGETTFRLDRREQ